MPSEAEKLAMALLTGSVKAMPQFAVDPQVEDSLFYDVDPYAEWGPLAGGIEPTLPLLADITPIGDADAMIQGAADRDPLALALAALSLGVPGTIKPVGQTPFGNSLYYAERYKSPRLGALTPEQSAIRDVAYGLKTADPVAIKTAARSMAKGFPGGVIVPVPSSSGSTEINRIFADALSQETGAEVADILTRMAPVESSRARALAGLSRLTPEQHQIAMKEGAILPIEDILLLDNVAALGGTIRAASDALGGRGTGLVYAADLPDLSVDPVRKRLVEPIMP